MGVTLQEAKKRAMASYRSTALDTNGSHKAQTGYRVTFEDLKIRTKDKLIVPFVPNEVQVRYLDKLCPQWREGIYDPEGLRELILKGRQEGFTTLVQAIFFCITLNEPNTQTVVIAADIDGTETIFQMVKRFYEYLPASKKPFAKYQSKRAFYWPSIDCYYSVGSKARGGTINNLHFSEAAWHPDAESIVAGLLQSVPLTGNAFIESTANGIGNFYQTEWEASGNGESTFRQHFCAWFENPEYRVEVPLEFIRTADEEKRTQLYDLDDRQLAWYRIKAKELKGLVRQEYPDSQDEAFLSSGHPYFTREHLKSMLGTVSQTIEFEIPTKHPRLTKASESLRIWKLPEADRTYVVSADTAEGLTEKGDPDFDSASVWDAQTWEQVGHLHGRWDTHEFGVLCAELGFWYNTALLGIERNNHGHAVINAALYSADYPPMIPGKCRGMYFDEGYDEDKRMAIRKPGVLTTPKTKYFNLDNLDSSIINGDIKINCPEMIAEMMRFVKLPGGKAGGESGSHDDRVMDAAIGDALLRLGLARNRSAENAIAGLRLLKDMIKK